MLCVPRRNKLAYPAGRVPGINRSHHALRGNQIIYSFACIGGNNVVPNVIDLISGTRCTPQNAISHKTLGPIGPVILGSGAVAYDAVNLAKTFPTFTVNDHGTLAGICYVDSLQFQDFFFGGANYNNAGFQAWRFSNSWSFELTNAGRWNPSWALFAGYYFFCMSGSSTLGIAFVDTDLSTGSIRSENQASSTWTPTSNTYDQNGSVDIVGMTGGLPSLHGGLACGVFLQGRRLNLSEMIAWANDPWSFWYPQPHVRAYGGFNLYPNIDEPAPADDADTIKSSVNPVADVVRFSLSDLPTGKTLTEPVVIRYRYKKLSADTVALTATLKQGSTIIAQWNHYNPSTSFTTAEQTLTTLQYSAVSNWNDLYIEFSATGPISSEAATFLARTTDLSVAETKGYRDCIDYWVAQGVFNKMDAAYIPATKDRTHARMNLLSTNYTITEVGPPPFTADVGYVGDGDAAKWLDTNFNPTTATSPKYAVGSQSFGFYSLNSRAPDFKTAFGIDGTGTNQGCILRIRSDTGVDNFSYSCESAFFGEQIAGNTQTKGMYVCSRVNNTGVGGGGFARKNEGSFSSTGPGSGGGIRNANAFFLSYNFNGAGDGSNDTMGAGFIGGALTVAEADAVAHGFNLYMTALGINVY